MKILLIFLLLCPVLTASSAFAYRPFYTEDAGVAGNGIFQLEQSWDYFKWKNGDTDQIWLLVAPIYGPAENIELSVETPYLVHRVSGGQTTDGIGDINLVIKYVLAWERYETKDALFTLKGIAKLNSGDYNKGLGRGDAEYSLVPVFTKLVNKDLTVHGQFGYTVAADKQNQNLRNYTFYSMAADYTLTRPFHLAVEVDGNQHPDRTLPDQRLGLVGFIYTPNDKVSFDATYKKGFSSSSPAWSYGLGVAIQFN